jgi:hypothetical protein
MSPWSCGLTNMISLVVVFRNCFAKGPNNITFPAVLGPLFEKLESEMYRAKTRSVYTRVSVQKDSVLRLVCRRWKIRPK